MTIQVELNGTNENPYHIFGLSQNPFPQVAEAGKVSAILALQKLGGDPIPNVEYIRETLKGWSKEFVDLCCKQFKPGEYVKFTVTFDENK